MLARIPEKDRESASEWLLEKRASGLAGNSIRNYAFSLKALSELCPKPLLECERNDVMSLLADVQERYRDPYLYKHVLRDFLRSNELESLISGIRLNRRKKKKEWQDPEKVIDRSDLGRMLAAAGDLRDRCILAVLWDSGARCHEVAAIRIGDLKLQKRKSEKPVYTVWFRKSKTAGEERRIPLYESSRFILQCLRSHPDHENHRAPLFVSKRRGPVAPLGTKGIRGIVKSSASKAGIGKPCTPHSFRHGRATDLKRLGVSDDAMRQWLGWSRGSPMPLRYVSRKAEEKVEEVATKLGYEPLPPPGPVEELLPDDLIPEELPPVVIDEKAIVERLFEKVMESIKKDFGDLHKVMEKEVQKVEGKK